jgi:predicted nucleic acid-binding protein
MIVVDASLAVKWFLAEPDSEGALAFLDRHRRALCGPDLLAIEVCRALVTAANTRRVSAEAAKVRIAAWLSRLKQDELRLYHADATRLQRATDLALDLGHPLADCLYLALAIELECELATCDAKFQAKAAPIYPRVKLLSEFS